MKKCPYCAEEIQDAAIKCKHCKHDLTPKIETTTVNTPLPKKGLTKPAKAFLIILIAILAIMFWYFSIPAIIIWYVWKKSKLNTKNKILATIGLCATAVILQVGSKYYYRTPFITVTQNAIVSSSTAHVAGAVSPANSSLQINGRNQSLTNGQFSLDIKLVHPVTTVTINAIYHGVLSTQSFEINRGLTPVEAADKAKADAAQQKAIDQQAAKDKAAQAVYDKSKAGRICKTHPTWSKDDCKNVADDMYWIGMTLDMLKTERGLPDRSNPSDYGGGTHWQWCWDEHTPSCFYGGDDGIVTSYN